MYKNNIGGLFVAFDGPNGAGKSTLMSGIERELKAKGVKVYATKEPSAAVIGEFTRQISETVGKFSLACLVAADRYHHIDAEIKPKLAEGYVVMTDRYLLSSLILQQIDGVDAEFILSINNKIVLPDIQVAVMAKDAIIESRLNERKGRTRFEQKGMVLQELEFLESGAKVIQNLGVPVTWIDNTSNLEKNISNVANCIFERVSLDSYK